MLQSHPQYQEKQPQVATRSSLRRVMLWLPTLWLTTALISPSMAQAQDVPLPIPNKERPADLRDRFVTPQQVAPSTTEAPRVKLRSGEHAQFVRLVFDLPQAQAMKTDIANGRLIVRFAQPLQVDARVAMKSVGGLIADPQLAADERSISFAMLKPLTTKVFTVNQSVVIDLMPAGTLPATQTAPAASSSSSPAARVKQAAPAESPSQRQAQAIVDEAVVAPPPETPSQAPVAEKVAEVAPPAAVVKDAPTPPPAAVVPSVQTPSPQMIADDEGDDALLPLFPDAPTAVKLTAKNYRDAFDGDTQVDLVIEQDAQSKLWRLIWPETTKLAVVPRQDYVWLVFDQEGRINWRKNDQSQLNDVEQLQVAGATVLRVPIREMLPLTVVRNETTWVIRLGHDKPAQQTYMTLLRDTLSTGVLSVLVAEPAQPVSFIDAARGDQLHIVPVDKVQLGMQEMVRMPQLSILPTPQGLAISTFDEKIKLNLSDDRVTISHPQQVIGSKDIPGDVAVSHKRWLDWTDVPQRRGIGFVRQRQAMMDDISRKQGVALSAARLKLAHFYLGHDLWPEAKAIIDTVVADDPAAFEVALLPRLQGALAVMSNDVVTAERILMQPKYDQVDDINLWRAAVKAMLKDWPGAAELFNAVKSVPTDYPPSWQLFFGRVAAKVAQMNNDTDGAIALIERLQQDPQLKDDYLLRFQLAELYSKKEDHVAAERLYQQAAFSRDLQASMLAQLALIEKQIAAGKLKPEAAAKRIEKIRFRWRGDESEQRALTLLAEQYFLANNYRDALDTWRRTLIYFPDIANADEISEKMQKTFLAAFSEENVKKMSPIQAVSLFDEFRELTPTGADGDSIITMLADRLAAVDLLDRASELLFDQVKFRLTGVPKAEVGFRLAVIHVLNQQPKEALEALSLSNVPNMPEALRQKRLQLAARAYGDDGQPEKGVEVLETDTSPSADQLRVELFWQNEDWMNAALALERMVERYDLSQPLTTDQAQSLLNLAVAYALADDDVALEELRRRYLKPMEQTQLKDTFAVVVKADLSNAGVRRDLASQFAGADQLSDFMKQYRTIVAQQGVSGIKN